MASNLFITLAMSCTGMKALYDPTTRNLQGFLVIHRAISTTAGATCRVLPTRDEPSGSGGSGGCWFSAGTIVEGVA